MLGMSRFLKRMPRSINGHFVVVICYLSKKIKMLWQFYHVEYVTKISSYSLKLLYFFIPAVFASTLSGTLTWEGDMAFDIGHHAYDRFRVSRQFVTL